VRSRGESGRGGAVLGSVDEEPAQYEKEHQDSETTRGCEKSNPQAPSCNTAKDDVKKQKISPLLKRTAGVVAFIKPCGVIVMLRELFGAERYGPPAPPRARVPAR
jgi:hypothetical protein